MPSPHPTGHFGLLRQPFGRAMSAHNVLSRFLLHRPEAPRTRPCHRMERLGLSLLLKRVLSGFLLKGNEAGTNLELATVFSATSLGTCVPVIDAADWWDDGE